MSKRISHHAKKCTLVEVSSEDGFDAQRSHQTGQCIGADGKTRNRRVGERDDRQSRGVGFNCKFARQGNPVGVQHKGQCIDERQGQRRGASQVGVPCKQCGERFEPSPLTSTMPWDYESQPDTCDPCVQKAIHEMVKPAPVPSVESAVPKQQPDEYWTKRMAIVLPKIIEPMKVAARAKGYALAFHGSLSRDIDCIAVPWTDDARPAPEVAEAIRQAAADANGGIAFSTPEDDAILPIAKPHGRLAWRWHLGGGPYIDLSVAASSPVPKLVEALRKIPDSRSIGATSGWLERELVCATEAANRHWRAEIQNALSDYDSHSLARNEKGKV